MIVIQVISYINSVSSYKYLALLHYQFNKLYSILRVSNYTKNINILYHIFRAAPHISGKSMKSKKHPATNPGVIEILRELIDK